MGRAEGLSRSYARAFLGAGVKEPCHGWIARLGERKPGMF